TVVQVRDVQRKCSSLIPMGYFFLHSNTLLIRLRSLRFPMILLCRFFDQCSVKAGYLCLRVRYEPAYVLPALS
ncbi:MAG: hypothetical protein D6736_15290, partial [Nitrospinota bacterium]